MAGLRPSEFQGRVHAGVVIGWVHKPAAFIIEKRLGRGKLGATTFRLHQEAPDGDKMRLLALVAAAFLLTVFKTQ
ncbi:hypothetical protein AB9F39_35375, partial [Rhizobium leguminosarum]